MLSTSGFAEVATLVGDPARANMLTALMDGRARTATELAFAAGVTRQTASGHLMRLKDAGLLIEERQGRHRYHRLLSADVAHMLESIMLVAAGLEGKREPVRRSSACFGPRDKALRHARTCYDYLAGRLAVAIADDMIERGYLDLSPDGGVLSEDGARFLHGLGIDIAPRTHGNVQAQRTFCRPCLDWSERRPHIAGAVGAALLHSFLGRGWLCRIDGTRGLTVTRAGQAALANAFDLPAGSLIP